MAKGLQGHDHNQNISYYLNEILQQDNTKTLILIDDL